MHPDLQPGHLLHNNRYRIISRLDRRDFGMIYGQVILEDLGGCLRTEPN